MVNKLPYAVPIKFAAACGKSSSPENPDWCILGPVRIGVDLGGTKNEAIALSDGGEVLVRERIESPHEDYRATLFAIIHLVANVCAKAGCDRKTPVGVGIPGAISPSTKQVKNANSTWLIGHEIDKDLSEALGCPVRVANDANCFAVSEAVDGAAKGYGMVFGVILGTGVGGGIAIDGRTHAGLNAIAGEWGHNPLPWPGECGGMSESPGPKCYCGQHGCIETFLSGPGLAADYAAQCGKSASAERIAADAEQGDEAAVVAICRYIHRLARSLAGVINILDPDAIVFGGGLSNIDAIYETLPGQLGQFVFSDQCTTPILKNKHGDSSGVRGAAWLWPPGVSPHLN